MYEDTDVFPVAGEVRVLACDDERAEAEFVADTIASLLNDGHDDIEGPVAFEQCAIIGRNKFVFTPIIEVLEEREIEFYKMLSAASVESGSELIVQFELALRILANPLDRLHVGILARECRTGLSAEDVYDGMNLREMTGMDVIERIVEKGKSSTNASTIKEAVECLKWSTSDFKLIPALDCLERHAAALEDEPRNRVIQDVKQWKQRWNYFVRSEQGGSHSVGSFLKAPGQSLRASR